MHLPPKLLHFRTVVTFGLPRTVTCHFGSDFFCTFLLISHPSQAKTKAPKPNRRKKWGKAAVQLIPVAPPPALPETTMKASEKPDDGISLQGDIPLKLPRAMRTPAPTGSNVLRERNADPGDETILSKEEAGEAAAEVLVPQARRSDDKENHAS